MTMKRSFIAAFAILACSMFAWATGAGRPYPASAGGVIDPTCTSSLPCIQYDNNGSGPAIRGISVNGAGVSGTSKSAGNFPGVFGTSTASAGRGVEGSAPLIGVEGVSPTIGVLANASTSTGVAIQATGGRTLFLGREGFINVFSVDSGGNVAAGNITVGNVNSGFVQSTGGTFLASGNDTPLYAQGPETGVIALSTDPSAIHGAVTAQGAGGLVFQGFGSGAFQVMSVDDSGNLNITGHIFTAGSCSSGCIARGPNQRRIVSYVPHESQPTIEDFGEAQLVNGQAYVHLDPKFDNVIDQRANYLVFITPEGEANTLYVTQKSRSGFEVREIHGGRSTIVFSYRIVAKPFGSHEARLPMVELPKLRSGLPKQRSWHTGGVVPR